MEPAAIIKKIRAMSGITRKELAQLADVSPSTISRIERGEMDPTWGTMQKIFSATGYQLNGTSVVSSGDTSAIQAADIYLQPIIKRAFPPVAEPLQPAATTKATGPLPVKEKAPTGEWADRWKRTGWLKDSAGVDDLVAIAVTAGNAGKVARRRGARVPVEIPKGWRDLVDRLEEAGVDYAVSGIVATWEDRSDAQEGAPLIYVSDPRGVAEQLGLERARPGRGILLLEAMSGELDDVESEGGIRFVPRSRALLDAFSGPGRDPDKAEDLLRALWGRIMNNNFDPSGSGPADESDSSDELNAALPDRKSLNDVALVTVRMATDGGERTDLNDAMKVFGISRDELESEIDAGPHEI